MDSYFNKPKRKYRIEPSESLINWVPSFMLDSENSERSVDSDSNGDSQDVEPQEEDNVEQDIITSLTREYRSLAGPWDSHRFENKTWISPLQKDSSVEIQPTLPPEKGEPTRKTGPQDPVELTKKMIAQGLSYLERSPETLKIAYTKLVLSRKGIFSLDLLKSYKNIQYLDVSGNKLRTLEPLENLIYLKHLDASYNHLDTILDFKAPFFLTTVNLSHNKIRYMRDLSEFWSIVDLNLSHNYIKEIYGLGSLRYLNTLNLAHNEIEEVEHLECLRLQYLYLQNNLIKFDLWEDGKDPQFETLPNLRFINLSNNQIQSLKIFETVVNLEILELANNHIKQLLDIYYLRNLSYLSRLNLEGSPVTNLRRYVEVCVYNLKNLVVLDNQKINFDFWQKKQSQKIDQDDVLQQAYKQRLKLLIMEQVNQPVMWDWVQPFNIQPLGVIMLVGPKGSRRTKLMKTFCKACDGIILGVLHTTRPRHKDEVEGEDFYYISHEKFFNMLKNGEFLTFYETLGNYFGIAHKEFSKSQEGVLIIFRGDLISALALKSRFFNAKLVLAVTSTQSHHIKTLESFYSFTVDKDTVRIIRSPDWANRQQEQRDKVLSNLVEKDCQLILDNIVEKICLANSQELLTKLKALYSQVDSEDLFQMFVRGDPTMVEIPELLESLTSLFFSTEVWRELSGIMQIPEEIRLKHNLWNGNSITLEPSEEKANSKKNVSFAFGSKKDSKLSQTQNYILKCLKFLRDSTNLEQFPEDEDSQSDDTMRRIFDYFLRTRSQLLELHFSIPGLFRELVFPDNEEESIKKLVNLATDTVSQDHKYLKPILDLKEDVHFQQITQMKVEQCFRDISCEMSISQKQKDEFMETLNIHHAVTCSAKKCESDTNMCVRF